MAAVFGSLALSPDPVFVTDRHNRIVFWNQSAERILGFSSAEVVGKPCAARLEGCDAFGNRYCSESCPVTGMAARGESVNHFGLRLKGRDGDVVPVDVTILNLGGRAPGDFFLAHILRTERIELPSLQDSERAPPASPFVSSRESPDVRARRLSAREVEVLGMLAAGRSTPEIALSLHISNLTARNHIQNILHKLEVHSKSEAVAFAFQKRLNLV
jgi:DNA-binding CsgD family transcriptional regulator